jgi:hypothetical protein
MATTIKIEGTKMIITTDLTGKDLSSSGKSVMKATTSGFMAVEGSKLKVSLNVIEPLKK